MSETNEAALYLTVGDDPHGRGLLAIVSEGHPRAGDGKCVLLTLEVVPSMKAAKRWFKQMKVERPWETRQ